MPVSTKSIDETTANIDTSAPKVPTAVENPGTPGSYEGFGAVHKHSDSDAQPPVEPPAEDEPDDAFRDPVKEGV